MKDDQKENSENLNRNCMSLALSPLNTSFDEETRKTGDPKALFKQNALLDMAQIGKMLESLNTKKGTGQIELD